MRLFLLLLCLIGISILTSALVVQAKPPATITQNKQRQAEGTSAGLTPAPDPTLNLNDIIDSQHCPDIDLSTIIPGVPDCLVA